jgi:hypothetical protein
MGGGLFGKGDFVGVSQRSGQSPRTCIPSSLPRNPRLRLFQDHGLPRTGATSAQLPS